MLYDTAHDIGSYIEPMGEVILTQSPLSFNTTQKEGLTSYLSDFKTLNFINYF